MRLGHNTERDITGQAGLEAVFQVPIPGDSGSSPDAGSISNYFVTEVYPGLGILQTVESLPRLLLRHANILQCLALSMDEQYAV